ncbi:MAG TPA: hypothetical protein VF816_15200 [Rhodocyclaceae bacterium]
MPVTSLIPAIISSIIESASDQAAVPPAAAARPQGPVVGLVRTLPADSLRGTMSAAAIGSVQIDGKTLPMSPAAQIRNEANLIVMPTAVQQAVKVRYTVDSLGYVTRIWILTPAELAASL